MRIGIFCKKKSTYEYMSELFRDDYLYLVIDKSDAACATCGVRLKLAYYEKGISTNFLNNVVMPLIIPDNEELPMVYYMKEFVAKKRGE